MGFDERCSWDDGKRSQNRVNHGYDFADLHVVFDGRFVVTRADHRFDYGEDRYNMLVEFDGARDQRDFHTPRGTHASDFGATRQQGREEHLS